MFLIHLLKILFWLLVIRHTIKWVSYHIHHHNKKTRVFHGNCKTPEEVEFALMYGINAKTKTRFKFKDLSYRKTLAEWKQLLNSIYPPDNLTITLPPHTNPNPAPLLFLGGDKAHTRSRGGHYLALYKTSNTNSNLAIRNRKRKQFPQLKTRNNNFISHSQPFAKNNSVSSATSFNTKIIKINNLKISQNAIPFTKQIFACK
jgi:hypothetical protein